MNLHELSDEEGSVTAQTMAILILVMALAMGAILLLLQANKSVNTSREKASAQKELSVAVASAIDALKKNPSMEADSPFDPAYSLTAHEDVSLSINDLSSKINPNWLRKRIVDGTNLNEMLAANASGSILQQFREDHGLARTTLEYSSLFTPEALKVELGTYSYANINSSDEFSLRKLYYEATGDQSAAESFHDKITQQLQNSKIVTQSELELMLGLHGEKLLKVLTVQPQFNVNFITEFALKSLIGYDYFKIGGSSSVATAILNARTESEITETRLRQLLGNIDAKHPVLAYLGVRTFFWSIDAKKGKYGTTAIVARTLPFDAQDQEMKLTVIEVKNYENN
jgi:hypothetical protein